MRAIASSLDAGICVHCGEGERDAGRDAAEDAVGFADARVAVVQEERDAGAPGGDGGGDRGKRAHGEDCVRLELEEDGFRLADALHLLREELKRTGQAFRKRGAGNAPEFDAVLFGGLRLFLEVLAAEDEHGLAARVAKCACRAQAGVEMTARAAATDDKSVQFLHDLSLQDDCCASPVPGGRLKWSRFTVQARSFSW